MINLLFSLNSVIIRRHHELLGSLHFASHYSLEKLHSGDLDRLENLLMIYFTVLIIILLFFEKKHCTLSHFVLCCASLFCCCCTSHFLRVRHTHDFHWMRTLSSLAVNATLIHCLGIHVAPDNKTNDAVTRSDALVRLVTVNISDRMVVKLPFVQGHYSVEPFQCTLLFCGCVANASSPLRLTPGAGTFRRP